MWYHTRTYWDGRIAMCDRDLNLAYDLGNVRGAHSVVRALEKWKPRPFWSNGNYNASKLENEQ